MRPGRCSCYCCLQERTQKWRGRKERNTTGDNASVNTLGGSLVIAGRRCGVCAPAAGPHFGFRQSGLPFFRSFGIEARHLSPDPGNFPNKPPEKKGLLALL